MTCRIHSKSFVYPFEELREFSCLRYIASSSSINYSKCLFSDFEQLRIRTFPIVQNMRRITPKPPIELKSPCHQG